MTALLLYIYMHRDNWRMCWLLCDADLGREHGGCTILCSIQHFKYNFSSWLPSARFCLLRVKTPRCRLCVAQMWWQCTRKWFDISSSGLCQTRFIMCVMLLHAACLVYIHERIEAQHNPFLVYQLVPLGPRTATHVPAHNHRSALWLLPIFHWSTASDFTHSITVWKKKMATEQTREEVSERKTKKMRTPFVMFAASVRMKFIMTRSSCTLPLSKSPRLYNALSEVWSKCKRPPPSRCSTQLPI